MTETRAAGGNRADRDVVARGRLIGDGGGADDAADLVLRIPASTVVAGRGPADLVVDGPSIRLRGATIEWIVRTNAGWTHIRGAGTSRPDQAPATFRLDLLHGDDGRAVTRVALRVYAPEFKDEATAAPPILRIVGALVPTPVPVAPETATE